MVKWHGSDTFVSLPIAEGLAPKLISELCGHGSIAIAMDRYGHLFDSVADDHLRSDAIERAFELPSAAEAVAAASGPPPLTVRPELPWWPRPPRSGAAAG